MPKKVSRAQAIRVYLQANLKDKTKDVRAAVEKLGYGRPSPSEVSKARKDISKSAPKLKSKTKAVLDLVAPPEINAAVAFVNACGSFKMAYKNLAFAEHAQEALKYKLTI